MESKICTIYKGKKVIKDKNGSIASCLRCWGTGKIKQRVLWFFNY